MSSKVAQYLNEHLLGEATTADAIRKQFATDASLLKIIPDMVVYPRTTSDIRKVARFAWQLSEKGHHLSLTPRGGGTDITGAAIGGGIVVNMLSHMNDIFEIDPKQRLVRLQPGVTYKTLNDALSLQGLMVPSYPSDASSSTIGGSIANNSRGILSGAYGTTGSWVAQLEVVLASGDVLQTGRISKRDVARKKGQQDFEGEIYRGIDNLINDNAELVASLAADGIDNVGYNIAQVRKKDGSIDLAPLFIGSQGTLGVISEIIMRTTPRTVEPLVVALAFSDYDSLHDSLDQLRALNPTVLELLDGRLYEYAQERGKKYDFYKKVRKQNDVAAIVLAEFHGSSGRHKKKAGKQIIKLFKEDDRVTVEFESDTVSVDELRILAEVPSIAFSANKVNEVAPPLLGGVFVPPEQYERFTQAVAELEKKYHLEIALYGHAGQHVYFARPIFNLSKVGDRQRVFKLLGEWTQIVASHGGHLVANGGEGRLKAPFAHKELDEDLRELYDAVRTIFDPQGILNTGVKQASDLKTLVSALRTDYDGADFAARTA